MPPSRMQQMTALGADWWNDSGVPAELAEAVALGAVGGTSNPVIVSQAVKSQPEKCVPMIDRLVRDNPENTEDEIAWKLIHELAIESASKLKSVYETTRGAKGFVSVQVSPKFYPSTQRMVDQGLALAKLAPNIAVKIPATHAGVAAAEELTAQGVRINATVSFTVPQALAIAAALERGMKRAQRQGSGSPTNYPYITLMIGRVDDQLKRVAEREKIAFTPGLLDWAGIAVFKRAHQIFKERGLPGTLLAAAYRHEGHWSQIIGREVLQTIPYSWWTKFNTSPTEPTLTLEKSVDDALLHELRQKFPDFSRAYDDDGMAPGDFIRYGGSVHTLHQFLDGYSDLLSQVRSRMLP